jgi:hypothetical protein
VVAEGVAANEDRLVCTRTYFKVDALVNFEAMERCENMTSMTGSRSRDYSAGKTVLDSLGR